MIRTVTFATSKQQSKQQISLPRVSPRACGTLLLTCWEYRRMSHSFRRKARLPLQSSSALSVCFSGPSLLFLSSVVSCVFQSFLCFLSPFSILCLPHLPLHLSLLFQMNPEPQNDRARGAALTEAPSNVDMQFTSYRPSDDPVSRNKCDTNLHQIKDRSHFLFPLLSISLARFGAPN